MMYEETIFSKIIRKEIPADILFQDDRVTVFKDINPQAPEHLLIIPNKLIPTINDIGKEDEALLGYLFIVAAKMAKQLGVDEDGYRLIINCNRNGGQEVYHLHMHLLAGKRIGPMVCN